ncbi:hypothetical protein EGW08_007900 [Elysia chlorotica]|uniref:PDZ domain-containing protein n=1 Tax=Elysia chlorotica TaxID=188477 RepID=A0A433TS76_ELYCH|nr:hypothetical protein EGW08_007900 [Elysia chlorotica]
MAQFSVQLHRPPGTLWGFRLQGGRDFSSQLSVKKIENGSPAQGQLLPGDEIIGIGHTSTNGLTHMEANSLIKAAGNVLHLTIVRGPSQDFSHIKPTGPIKFSPWKYNQQQQNHY